MSDSDELYIASSESLYVDWIPYLTSDSLIPFCDLDGSVTAWDLAWEAGDLWVACEASGAPILKYDSSGSIIDQIESTLVPDATGLTMDDAGYLWASDNLNECIYKIDPEGMGTAETGYGAVVAPDLHLAPNPFTTCLTITAAGYGSPVTIRIYDAAGRAVRDQVTDGELSWSGRDDSGAPLPAGIYTVIASGDGTISSSRAVLLR